MKWVVLLALAGCASAQARIEGRVVDAAGAPVARAEVLFGPNVGASPQTIPAAVMLRNALSTTSNDDGTFVIEGIAPGSGSSLRARRTGYVDVVQGTFSLADGQTVRDAVLVLTPQAVITGRVTDQAGDPVSGTRVWALQSRFVGGQHEFFAVATGATDERGVYRIAGLAPGLVVVRANAPGLSVVDRRAELHIDTYFGGVADVKGARPVELSAGAEQSVDIRLLRTPVFKVRGKVVDESGAPIRASLTVLNGRSDSVSATDGTFTLHNVLPGPHEIVALTGQVFGQPFFTHIAVANVTVAGDIEDMTIRLGAGPSLKGRVVSPAPPPSVEVTLQPQERIFAVGAAPAEDGALVFPGLLRRVYRMRYAVPDTFSIRSVKFNGEDARATGIDLTKVGGELEIVLSDKPAEVSGTAALRNALVAIWPEEADKLDINHGVRTASIDQNGAFRIAGLAPGVYLLAAWDGAEEGLLINDDFRARFAGEALRIEVAEGSRNQGIEVPVISAIRIAEEAEKLP